MFSRIKIIIPLGMTVLCFNPLIAQWEPDLRLTYNDSLSATNWNSAWSIAANGDTVLIVWWDERDGNREIYFKRSLDGGVNWTTDTRLTNDPASSLTPAIALSNNFVHVIWEDNRQGNPEIYYNHSEDGGLTWWFPDMRLSYTLGGSIFPSIAVSGDNVYAVWVDHDYGTQKDEIRYKHSLNGYVWDPDIRITEYDNLWNPSISVSGNYIHVVWDDIRDLGIGHDEIYYKRSTDGGVTWSPDIRLTNEQAKSWYPSIACSGNNVHVVWEDWRDGNREIYYKRSIDNGLNWSPDTRLTYTITSGSYNPNIAVSGNKVHIVWIEEESGQYEIYYKCSTNNGTSWGLDIRLTTNPAGSYSPSIAVSGSKVHVLWVDERDGNSEIYYKRNPTGNAIEEISIPNQSPKYFITSTFFTSSITLRFSESSCLPLRIAIYNIYGTLVYEKILTSTPLFITLKEKITVLPPGIYFLSVSQKGKNLGVVKMIKLYTF